MFLTTSRKPKPAKLTMETSRGELDESGIFELSIEERDDSANEAGSTRFHPPLPSNPKMRITLKI